MTSRPAMRLLRTATLCGLGLFGACGAASAVTLVINSGPNIKDELFRSDGSSAIIWEEIAFTFTLPAPAAGDGIFHMFAGGDLNNLNVDRIDVTSGPFGDRTNLGTFAFPIGDTHFTACENPPHTNPAGCPIPETVPGGAHNNGSRGPDVGEVQGRRNTTDFNAGIPGLIVPQAELTGGSILISLFVRTDIYDLYIDRLELTYPTLGAPPIPEPGTYALMLGGLALMGAQLWRRRR